MSENFELLGTTQEDDNNQPTTSTTHQQPLRLQPIHLTPQQQYELTEHLSPTLPVISQPITPGGVVGGSQKGTPTSPTLIQDLPYISSLSPLSSSNSLRSASRPISPLMTTTTTTTTPTETEKEKKKKKKDKKKKKKNKEKDSNNSENEQAAGVQEYDDEQQQHDEKNDNYTTEMSKFDSGNIIQRINNEIGGGDMYFGGDGGGGKKKKKKKKEREENLTPEERRIKEESKDAKSFFSNERTFLSWIGLTFSLGAIGTAIITWFGTEGVSLATGLFLWIIAILFMAYSTLQFRRRGAAIRNKTQGPFDDQKGPLALVVMVVIGVSIYLVFFVAIRPSANISIGDNHSKNVTSK